MTWLSNMTKAEKEQYVIQLYEDKNYKEIAKLTHKSIGAIIKRHQENIERENGQLEETNEDYDVKSKSKVS